MNFFNKFLPRTVEKARKLQKPAQPSGVKRANNPQKAITPRSKDTPGRENRRRTKFRATLEKRYDVDEANRRHNLTNSKNVGNYNGIGTPGWKDHQVIKGNLYARDQSPFETTMNKVKQYASQLQSEFTQRFHVSANQDVFRDKRTVYTMHKNQPFTSDITGK